MRFAQLPTIAIPASESLRACLAAVLDEDPATLPAFVGGDPASIGVLHRWLGGLGVGLVPVADPAGFSWPGPWVARVRPPGGGDERFVLMYGVPSGAIWDPAGNGAFDNDWIVDGYLVAAADIALARPPRPRAPVTIGRVEQIWVSPSAGEPATPVASGRALPGQGIDGDRHVTGAGTFPSGLPGSALTLIEAEVCESFDPPLGPDDHRRNVLTRGVALNDLVGHEFTVGAVRCRGMRLCEPCTVVQRYAGRPVLRALVHRGGLRADILSEGEIHPGDEIRAVAD
ncbi:MAG: MOSC domain-containing protein [Solirubrobacteraceae bacterium]